jgi:PRC-barrel domain
MEDLGPPISYLVLERGVPVFSSDGERLGKVVRVQRDIATHIFDGIVFATGSGPGGRRFVDAPEVGEIYEGGVVLRIDAREAGELPSPRSVA